MKDQPYTIEINAKTINVSRYGYDTVILSECLKGLHTILDCIYEREGMDIKINKNESKFLLCSPYSDVNRKPIERVHKFLYSRPDPEMEIETRITMAKTTFTKMKIF